MEFYENESMKDLRSHSIDAIDIFVTLPLKSKPLVKMKLSINSLGSTKKYTHIYIGKIREENWIWVFMFYQF